MADLPFDEQTQVVRINGRDEQFVVDSIQEDSVNKLWVKSTIVPEAVGNLFFIHAQNGGSDSMNINGAGTPVVFTVPADASKDLLVDGLCFEAFSNGIKIDNFLGLNSSLTNGLLIQIKSQDEIFEFLPIKTTQEFDSHFAWGSGRSFEIIFASGNDSLVSRFGVASPFILKKAGTYATDDYIRVTVRDNLSQISGLKLLAVGAKK